MSRPSPPATTPTVTRVVICEETSVTAETLRQLLDHDPQIEVVAVVDTAESAIAAVAALRPDLLTIDIDLPRSSGMQAIEQLMATLPLPILVISSRPDEIRDAAVAAGALDVHPRRQLDRVDAAALCHRVRLLGRARVIRHPRANLVRAQHVLDDGRRVSAIGICASTGGPGALATVLAALPASFPIPILVVQHMTAGFTEGLAAWLRAATAMPVAIAEPDGTARARGVWVAPDGYHLTLTDDGRFTLDHGSGAGYHRPSADELFTSMARTLGSEAAVVVLTGMGRDGAAGLHAVRAAGGLTVAQDEASSAVFGMPRAAIECGAEIVCPLEGIAHLLTGLTLAPVMAG